MISLKKSIWYQVENHNINFINRLLGSDFIHLREAIKTKEQLQEAASTLILQAKRESDDEYTTLNAKYFRNTCSNSFKKLINDFSINQGNPIKVILLVTTSDNNRIQELEAQLAALWLSQETSSLAGPSTSTTGTQAPADNIHIRYNDQTFAFPRNILEFLKVSNVDNLIGIIKPELKTSNKEVSEKVINFYRGEDEILDLETSIAGLYNMEDDALGVVVGDGSSSSEEKGEGSKNV